MSRISSFLVQSPPLDPRGQCSRMTLTTLAFFTHSIPSHLHVLGSPSPSKVRMSPMKLRRWA